MSGIIGKNSTRGSGAIGTSIIAADAVDGTKIADDAIDSEHYTDGSIDNAHIADDAIDSEHYADGSIDNAHIADDAIDSEHYADVSIDTAHIGNLQVTTAKIAADAVTGAKIADDAIDSEHYADGSIDNAHIADDAIDSEHYADGSIDNAHIADDAIDSEHYADGSIDNAHIADDAIDSEHYADGSIDTAHIATNQIDETLIKDAFVGDFTDVTVTAADSFLYGDATDSGNTKKDTVQGILDLVPAGGGGTAFVQTITVSNVATLDVDTAYGLASGTYTGYFINIEYIYGNTNEKKVCARFSDDDGGTWESGGSAYKYWAHGVDWDGVEVFNTNTGTDRFHLTPTNIISGASAVYGGGVNGQIFFPVWNSSSNGMAPALQWQINFAEVTSDDKTLQNGAGYLAGATDSGGWDAIQFFMDSGNISAKMHIYGFKRS